MDFLNRYPAITVLLCLSLLGGAAYFIVLQIKSGSARPTGDVWFYNLQTQELFPQDDLSLSPVDTESGPATGVRAFVYSCEDCSDPNNRVIAYLQKLAPLAKKAVEEQLAAADATPGSVGLAVDKHEGGVLVRSMGNSQWFPESSPQGQAIIKEGKAKAGCEAPKPCLPPP